jgi:hypothetical protein
MLAVESGDLEASIGGPTRSKFHFICFALISSMMSPNLWHLWISSPSDTLEIAQESARRFKKDGIGVSSWSLQPESLRVEYLALKRDARSSPVVNRQFPLNATSFGHHNCFPLLLRMTCLLPNDDGVCTVWSQRSSGCGLS